LNDHLPPKIKGAKLRATKPQVETFDIRAFQGAGKYIFSFACSFFPDKRARRGSSDMETDIYGDIVDERSRRH
jgi:hypothetical protein